MKMTLSIFLSLIVISLIVSGLSIFNLQASASTSSPASSPELLKNAGLDLDLDNNGIPDNWWRYPSTCPPNATCTLETGISGITGDLSVAVNYTQIDNTGVYFGQVISPYNSVIPGNTYTLSSWLKMNGIVKGSSQAGVNIYARWYDSNNTKIRDDYIVSYLSGGDNNWHQYTGNVTAPLNGYKAEVRFEVYKVVGKVWWDDFSFKFASSPTINLYNIVHKKYIYQPQKVSINFSLNGYVGAAVNVIIVSPNGNITPYSIIMQSTSEDESITYSGINEFGIYNVNYSSPNFTKTSIFEYKNKPILTFVSESDQHYGYTNDTISSGFTINRSISDINNQVYFPSPDFVVLVGDTVDNRLYNHISDSKASIYDKLNIPYYPTMADHETYNGNNTNEPVGYKGQTFYNSYGSKYNYTITKGNYTFIFGGVKGDYPLLTNYAGDSFGAPNYSIWLGGVLAASRYKPAIAFSHYSAQQPRDNGNQTGNGSAQYFYECAGIVSGCSVDYASNTRSIFEKWGNMPLEFSGHAHVVSKNVTNNITYVSDGAIINEPYIFDYVEIYPDKIQVHTMPYRLDTDNNIQFYDYYWKGSYDSTHTAENYSKGNPGENDFTITLVNITVTKLTNLWNFTAENINVSKITLGNNNIISNNVLVNLYPYEVRNILNMTVVTQPDNIVMNVNVTKFNTTGDQLIKFNESSPSNSTQISYNVGDRTPNQLYSVKIYWQNGTKYQDFNVVANNTGYISYNLSNGGSRYHEIKTAQIADTSFTVTIPVGYTFLRFNALNSTVTNLDPDGQSNLQPIFNITNYGNIIQGFRFYLNGTITNITTYADLDNNHTTGRIEISTSSTIVVPNLNPGSSQNVWIVIDANKAPAAHTNRTLTINNS